MLVALVLAIAGQWVLASGRSGVVGLMLYVGALVPTLAALPRSKSSFVFERPFALTSRRAIWRYVALGACLVASVLSFTQNTNTDFTVDGAIEYQFTIIGVLAWISSILLFLLIFWQPEKSWAEWEEWLRTRIRHLRSGIELHASWTTVALVAVLAIGVFFYFYRINLTPAEMTSDHAEKLLDVNDVLEGHHPVFFIRNTGREPLQFYVTAGIIDLTGIPLSHLALKLGTALIGFLTIPATFLLARAMYGDTVGILAAFFVAVSRWPLAIARMGLRFPFTPFFAALSLYFVWRALVHQKRNDFLIAGLLLGAGLYGYIPSRNVPLVALGFIVLWILVAGRKYLPSLRPFVVNVGLTYGLLLVVFLPLLRYSVDFPEMFWYRALTRFTSLEQPVQGSLPVVFMQNLANLALMFNWRGDSVWVTNIPHQPAMDVVSGALFVLGIVIALYGLVRRREIQHLFLLAGLAALLMPSALSFAFPIENPSLARTGGAIPLACIVLALPLAALVRGIRGMHGRWRRAVPVALVGMLLVVIAGLNYRWYFIDYDLDYRIQSQNSSEVAAAIKSFATSVGDLQHAYFVSYPYWLDSRAVAINLGDVHWHQYALDVSELQMDDSQNQFFVIHPEDHANMAKLQALYPWGQVMVHHSRTPGKDFLTFFVPARPRGS